MIQRYPHEAHLILPHFEDVEENGIVGRSVDRSRRIKLNGRFEFKSRTDEGYDAIFFCPATETRLKEVVQDDASFELDGRTWNVIRIIPRQTHTAIWLQ